MSTESGDGGWALCGDGKWHRVHRTESDMDGGSDIEMLCGKVYPVYGIDVARRGPLTALLTNACSTCEALETAIKRAEGEWRDDDHD